jgi:hypothetical protein
MYGNWASSEDGLFRPRIRKEEKQDEVKKGVARKEENIWTKSPRKKKPIIPRVPFKQIKRGRLKRMTK